jgi:hypothetical protein
MAQANVSINLTAKDNASKVFEDAGRRFTTINRAQVEEGKRLNASMAAYMNEAKQATSATNQLSQAKERATVSSRGMFASFTAATLAANAITASARYLKDQFQQSIKVAQDYSNAMAGLSSAANSFGHNAGEVRTIAKQASSDGLVPLTANAAALRNLMQSGLGLDQATTLLERMKDEAAYGRANTIDYGTAVENLGQAFRSEQSALGNLSGHQANFSEALEIGAAALGKTVAQLSAAERLQAKYIGYLQQGAYAQGDAAKYAATAAGEQARANFQWQNAQRILGTGLLPAVTMLRQGFVQMITGGMQPAEAQTQALQGTFLALATGIRLAMNAAVGFGRGVLATAESIRTGSLQPLRNAMTETGNDFTKTFQDMDDGFDKIAAGAYEAAEGQVSLADTTAAETSKAMKKMQADIDEANKQFTRSQEQRLKDFRESLDDMVIAHRDKTRAIEADIAEETAAYKQAVVDRQTDLNTDLAKLEDQHGKKVADITKKITEERQRGIIVDGVHYANANQTKLAELDTELTEEQAAYQQSIDERRLQYEADVAADQAKHDAKLLQLNTTLAEEKAILQRHAAEVAAVGEKQKEDDISRLKRQFAEENALADLNHREQVAKIRQQGNEQGGAYAGGYASGVRDKAGELSAAAETAFKSFMQGIERGVASGGLVMGGAPKPKGGNFIDWISQTVGTLFSDRASGRSDKLWPFAEGGIINRPTLLVDQATGRPYGQMAERGPEAIVPAGKIQQGLPGSSGVQVTIGTQVFHSNLDQTSFLRQMYWESRR